MGQFPRGSEWRQWDLHVHSPASFHWAGERYGSDPAANTRLVDGMINAFNAARPAVFGLMDYWSFDGWFRLKERLIGAAPPTLSKMVFPGIELRLAAPMSKRLNAHVLFSNLIADQHLHDFKSRLTLEITRQPLSDPALIAYSRAVGADLLVKHGFLKSRVDAEDDYALVAGSSIAEINVDSYVDAIKHVPGGQAVGFMPYSTSDGLSEVDWSQHYAYFLGLFSTSPIFETREIDTWAAFAGIETPKNKKWIAAFQRDLKGVPRLAVSGSDAHRLFGTPGDNDNRGYGDYPSGKVTWIKADPTWRGLLQAIKEPAKRSAMGAPPEKLGLIEQNKTFYIDQLTVKAAADSYKGCWLDGCEVALNPDLVAIIGNKGSGKSALADILSLVGNSQQHEHFSFLKRDRFRGKAGEPAKFYEGEITWVSGDRTSRLLSDDAPTEMVELVRYIPQGRFEALCNDHVARRSDAFEQELRSVIFSHVTDEIRLGALDFDQLIQRQEATHRARLNELRRHLTTVNEEIVAIEDQLNPVVKKNVEEQLGLKQRERAAHLALAPAAVEPPAAAATPEQAKANERLATIAERRLSIETALGSSTVAKQTLATRKSASSTLLQRIELLSLQVNEFFQTTEENWNLIGLPSQEVVQFSIDRLRLSDEDARIAAADTALTSAIAQHSQAVAVLDAERATLTALLNAPQKAYQAYLQARSTWSATLKLIEGAAEIPESVAGLQARLRQLSELPSELEKKRQFRTAISRAIYGVLDELRSARESLFAPVQTLIESNDLIRNDYKLEFRADLRASPNGFSNQLFDLVKQQVGPLRGEDESNAAIAAVFDQHPLSSPEEVGRLVDDLFLLLNTAARLSDADDVGIHSLLRKDRKAVAAYDFIFGLEYLEPSYTLRFQDAPIEQLSPGQRGALLLIFYLLVDKKRNPIVLDQPEENLDNETIVSLLVPVVVEAKRHRQIVMVTHNPNLAVVCDAEQIIHAAFD